MVVTTEEQYPQHNPIEFSQHIADKDYEEMEMKYNVICEEIIYQRRNLNNLDEDILNDIGYLYDYPIYIKDSFLSCFSITTCPVGEFTIYHLRCDTKITDFANLNRIKYSDALFSTPHLVDQFGEEVCMELCLN